MYSSVSYVPFPLPSSPGLGDTVFLILSPLSILRNDQFAVRPIHRSTPCRALFVFLTQSRGRALSPASQSVTATAAWSFLSPPYVRTPSLTTIYILCSQVQVDHIQQVPQYQAIPPPPLVVTETTIEIATSVMTVTQTEHHTQTLPTRTVTVPAPANTRIVASPAPESFKRATTPAIPRTTSLEKVVEEVVVQEAPSPVYEEEEYYEEEQPRARRGAAPRRSPNKWFGW